MAYNYGPPPGAYNARQPSYGYPAPGMGLPPNMGAPPGMDAAPGMNAQSPIQMQNPQFQPPRNMPNINFNAPVIRLGVQDQGQGGKPSTPSDRLTSGQGGARGSNAEPLGNRNRLALGASGGDGRNLDRERAAVRESMMALQPPTREEVARTIFIGGLGEGAPSDGAIENILRCAGKLRRWTRARDADDRACKFGFAEYEDVESLEAANEILVDVEVPAFKSGNVVKNDEGEVKKMKLLVVVDDQSKNYIDEWKGKKRESDDARQFRIDGCKEDLRQCLAGLANVGAYMANGLNGEADGDGDVRMGEANGEKAGDNAEVVTIPLTLEDELSDIPAEMRATVAEEIKAFRDRSNRRDIERMRREEDMEQAERQRAGGRVNRLASPPPSGAPSGPASAANGIPVGPRDRTGGVQGAPAGPRGYRGAQIPSDYINGVAFVGSNGVTNGIAFNREDEDAVEETDEELERRRQAKKEAELEKQYLDAERRWLNRERTRGAALEREKVRDEAEKRDQERQKEVIAKRLQDWDDDREARIGDEEYYNDRSGWVRRRTAYRNQEERDDERDRMAEEREKADERKKAAEARGLADNFMDQMDVELESRATESSQPAVGGGASGFKMSLGSAAARTKAAATSATAPRRATADVEGLLEDEEDAAASGLKRPELKPIPTDFNTTSAADMTESERAAARQDLATSIPTSTQDLFAYPVKFSYLTPALLHEQVRPFVEKKVVEFLGVQEDLLVDTVVAGLEQRKDAREIMGELEDAMEGEAEVLVRKVWRLVVFVTEGEARGLS